MSGVIRMLMRGWGGTPVARLRERVFREGCLALTWPLRGACWRLQTKSTHSDYIRPHQEHLRRYWRLRAFNCVPTAHLSGEPIKPCDSVGAWPAGAWQLLCRAHQSRLFLFCYVWGVLGLSLVCSEWGCSLVAVLRLLIAWPLSLWSTGSRHAGFSSCDSWALECELQLAGLVAPQNLESFWTKDQTCFPWQADSLSTGWTREVHQPGF